MFEFTLIKRLSLFALSTALILSAVACTRDKPAEVTSSNIGGSFEHHARSVHADSAGNALADVTARFADPAAAGFLYAGRHLADGCSADAGTHQHPGAIADYFIADDYANCCAIHYAGNVYGAVGRLAE